MSSEATPEGSKHESLQNSPRNENKEQEKNDIINYPYKNKQMEKLCDNFVENLFLVNPKSYESFVANNISTINKPNTASKNDLKLENNDKKYSIENSPVSDEKKDIEEIDESDEINNKPKNVNILSYNNEESDKEITQKNKDNAADNLEKICKNFVDEIFSQEIEKYSKSKKRDE